MLNQLDLYKPFEEVLEKMMILADNSSSARHKKIIGQETTIRLNYQLSDISLEEFTSEEIMRMSLTLTNFRSKKDEMAFMRLINFLKMGIALKEPPVIKLLNEITTKL